MGIVKWVLKHDILSTMNEKLASQGAESIIAHLWVKKYLPVISSALHAHQAAWVEKISGDEFLRTYYEVPDGDPHSRPFCNFLNQLPPEILEGVSVITGFAVANRGAFKQQAIEHKVISLGNVKVDFTFGQFADLDALIEEYPHLFEGRVFVGTVQDMEAVTGLKFLFTEDEKNAFLAADENVPLF